MSVRGFTVKTGKIISYFRRNNPTIFFKHSYVYLDNLSKYEIKNIGHQVRKQDNGDPIFICEYC